MTLIFDGRSADAPLVETIWYSRSEADGHFTSVAATHWEMVVTRFEGQTTFTVRGPETQATPVDYPPGFEAFGIIFKLGTFMPHLPVKTLLDRKDITLPEATRQSFWLFGSAWKIPTFENADTFVNRLVREGLLVHDPLVDDVLNERPTDVTVRTVRRRFLQATGLTLGTIRQIQRARYAAALLHQGVSILDAGYEAGYFDQPHMTRSLKQYMGQTPAQIARVFETVSPLWDYGIEPQR